MRWRKGVIMYLEIHSEATTEELITKIRSKCGKLMNPHIIPTSLVGAANCLSTDKRFVKSHFHKVLGIQTTVWGLNYNTNRLENGRDNTNLSGELACASEACEI
tara:strand:+ start:141 stop:452 length:312 start_codon:yes stop_codon:yes gene_type:complete